jgi:hypothetical protein
MSNERVIVTKPYPGITVYDNVFNWDDNFAINEMSRKTSFSLGWSDLPGKEAHFHSLITPDEWMHYIEDANTSKYLDMLANSQPFKDIEGRAVHKSVVNCDTIADSHTIHTHLDQDVILYYINIEWKDSWAGETFFYDENGENVVYTSPYTPNRMITFDGKIPHRFNGPSPSAPKYRFSVSTFFWTKEHEEALRIQDAERQKEEIINAYHGSGGGDALEAAAKALAEKE